MAYYDRIAKRWHAMTGYKGGVFKELVLNNILLEKLSGVENLSILELGAGNGYFLPLVLRRFSGQIPSKIIVTDQSTRLLEIAKRYFRIADAEYQTLEVGKIFPFAVDEFDLIIATMIFNEVHSHSFRNALKECHRILSPNGRFLITITHPDFINSLQKRGLIKPTKEGILTMPASGDVRLPVVVRSLENYRKNLQESGFEYIETEVGHSAEVLNMKQGLRHSGKAPVALIYTCKKSRS
jgi:SAM-dependent methyltransferase